MGVVTLMQEDHFRIETEDGVGLLFTLARSARIPREKVARLVATGITARVRYRGEPDFGAVAIAVEPVATRRAT